MHDVHPFKKQVGAGTRMKPSALFSSRGAVSLLVGLMFSLLLSALLLSISSAVTFVAAAGTASTASRTPSRGIVVDVEASWKDTPLLQEAVEWAARGGAFGHPLPSTSPLLYHNDDAVTSFGLSGAAQYFNGFDLLELLLGTMVDMEGEPPTGSGEKPFRLHHKTPHEQYECLMKSLFPSSLFSSSFGREDGIASSSSQRAHLEVALALRAYSPAVETHYRIAASLVDTLKRYAPLAVPPACDPSKTVNWISASPPEAFVLVYLPGDSIPQRVDTPEALSHLLFESNTTLKPRRNTSIHHAVGKEAWRRELWLGEDGAGHSILHPFPFSPVSLAEAEMVVVLFGLPLDESTMKWYTAIRERYLHPQGEAADGVHVRSPSSIPRVRYLFGHLPLSTTRLCSEQSSTTDASSASPTNANRTSTPLWEVGRTLLVQGYGVRVELRHIANNTVAEVSTRSSSSPPGESNTGVSSAQEGPSETRLQEAPHVESVTATTLLPEAQEYGCFWDTLHQRYLDFKLPLDSFADGLEREESSPSSRASQHSRRREELLWNEVHRDDSPTETERLGYGAVQYLFDQYRERHPDTSSSSRKQPNPGVAAERGVDRFRDLCEVVFNFPAYASTFNRLAVEQQQKPEHSGLRFTYSPSIDPAQKQRQMYLAQVQRELDALQKQVRPGASMAVLDGRPLHKNEESVHGLLFLLHESDALTDRLEEVFSLRPSTTFYPATLKGEEVVAAMASAPNTVAVHPVALSRVVQQLRHDVHKAARHHNPGGGSAASGTDYGYFASRIQIDESLVFWLNDVEKDPMYAEFHPSFRGLRRLAHGSASGSDLPRRNLFHMVVVLDPTSPSGLAGLKEALELLRKAVPIRIGVVLVQESWKRLPASTNRHTEAEEEGHVAKPAKEEQRVQDSFVRHLKDTKNRMRGMLKQLMEKKTKRKQPVAETEENDDDSLSLRDKVTQNGAFALLLEMMLSLHRRQDTAVTLQFLQNLHSLFSQVQQNVDKEFEEEEQEQEEVEQGGRVSNWVNLKKLRKAEKRQKDPHYNTLRVRRRQRGMLEQLTRLAEQLGFLTEDEEEDLGKQDGANVTSQKTEKSSAWKWIRGNTNERNPELPFRNDPLWTPAMRREALLDYYVQLRRHMGEMIFPSYPVLLLNGLHLRVETSLVLALQAEAKVLWSLVEHNVLDEATPGEQIYSRIMNHFHAIRSVHPSLTTSIPLMRWRAVTRTSSWVPPLLRFYQQRVFVAGGGGGTAYLQTLESALTSSRAVESSDLDVSSAGVPVVSGVLWFSPFPTLRTLDLLAKFLTASERIDGVFRLTWIPFLTPQAPQRGRALVGEIEMTLEHLLIATHGEVPSSLPTVVVSEDRQSSQAKKEKQRRKEQVRTSRKRDILRFHLVQRYLQFVLATATANGFTNLDATLLTQPELVSAVRGALPHLHGTDPLLYHHLFPIVEALKEQGHRDTGSAASPSFESHTHPILAIQQTLCATFREYMYRQAAVESALAHAAGLSQPSPQGFVFRNRTAAVEEPEPEGGWRPPSPLVLLLHGRAIRVEKDFTVEDVMEAVRRVLTLSQTLYRALQQVDFVKLSAEPLFEETISTPRNAFHTSNAFLPEDLDDPAFYSSRIVLLAGLLTQSEHSIAPLLSEVDLFPSIPSDPPQPPSCTMFRVPSPSTSRRRHTLTLVVDPANRDVPHLLSIAQFLLQSPFAVDLMVYLNPNPNSRPLQSFYRFVGRPQLLFDKRTGHVVAPSAVFRHLPQHDTLALDVDEPESWNVLAHRTEYDLDNIRLEELPPGVTLLPVTYRVQFLVLSGVVFTPTSDYQSVALAAAAKTFNGPVFRSPPTLTSPSSLPLRLAPYRSERARSEEEALLAESLVLSSTGYYQLNVHPGLWMLSLQPGVVASHFYISEVEGRCTTRESSWWSSTVLQHTPNPTQTTTVTHTTASGDGQRIPVLIDAFFLPPLLLTYDRTWAHPHVLETILLENALQPYVKWLEKEVKQRAEGMGVEGFNVLGMEEGETLAQPQRPTLNIFSIASGRLYERFLRIMMHSVSKSSGPSARKPRRRIKFWILEKFLSPQFKALLPKMAQHYDFEVGYVNYHWPAWLPRQHEKTRMLWAYKILFLDVLFPSSVDRILFLDADQIIMDDLHDLYELDFTRGGKPSAKVDKKTLQSEEVAKNLAWSGAPAIAMVPFCSAEKKNTATVPFRFWEENDSFWSNHLLGAPYYIGALFLIDLGRFRAFQGGDKYRSAYSRLVNDPQSLANMDQDLFNLMQHQLPIYALSEHWLWCETWCSAESRRDAKVIDLCQNPLTKWTKLESAKALIPNWDALDQELEALFDSFQREGSFPVEKTTNERKGPSQQKIPEKIEINDDL